MQRRQFLRRLAALPALGALGPALARAAESLADDKLPPIRALTKGPRFHWFGYYDKHQFSADNRFVLCNQVDFEGRSPRAEDAIRIGMVDLQDGDRWIELGTTTAWNWQQGCMLQWLPGSDREIIWNGREEGRYVSHVLDVRTRARRTLPHPIYNLSPDGRMAIAPDFRRLNDCRPGYGYSGIPDPNADKKAPDDAGIWRMDMASGKQELLFSFADAAKLPFTGGRKESAFTPEAKHWFNHLLFNTDGSRFFFLHRWRNSGPPTGRFETRAFTCDARGREMFCLDPHGLTSHFIWRDPQHVMAWAWHPSLGSKFYLYRDRTEQVEAVGPDVMIENGHNTYVPQTNNAWVLNDTYPDPQRRIQRPYLYHVPTAKKVPLGFFHSPPAYAGEWRCDNHPRCSRDGRWVCIDSAHEGGRQMYLIDISGVPGLRAG